MKFRIILPLLISILSTPVWANHYCAGTIKNVQLNRGGEVYATINNLASNAFLCDLSPADGGNDAEFCKALYSSLLLAQTTQQNVTFWFDIDTDKSCSKGDWVNLYKNHGLYHFMLGG